MHIPHQCFTQAAKEVQKYYEAADKVEQSIINHSVTAGALALVPLPGIAEVAMLSSTLAIINVFHKIWDNNYYSISPLIVKFLGHNITFQAFCRKRLDKLVEKLNNKGLSNSPYNDKKKGNNER